MEVFAKNRGKNISLQQLCDYFVRDVQYEDYEYRIKQRAKCIVYDMLRKGRIRRVGRGVYTYVR